MDTLVGLILIAMCLMIYFYMRAMMIQFKVIKDMIRELRKHLIKVARVKAIDEPVIEVPEASKSEA